MNTIQENRFYISQTISFKQQAKILKNDIKKIHKQVRKVKNSEQKQKLNHQITNLTQVFVHTAFLAKRENPDYRLPKQALRVYEIAKQILEPQEDLNNQSLFILSHGREFAFLADQNHFLYKHILTLDERWDKEEGQTFKVGVDKNGELFLRTYGANKEEVRHAILQLIEESQNDATLQFDLNYFSVARKVVNQSEKILFPTFKTKGDGNYYIAVVTDCPTKSISIQGHHAWIRLIDPEGNVISVGKFRERNNSPFVYEKLGTIFSSADRNEWFMRKGTIKEHRIRLTEAEFNHAKKDIESDMAKAHETDFLFFGKSCSDWAFSKIKPYVKLNKKEAQVDQFSILFESVWQIYNFITPLFLQKMINPLKHRAGQYFLLLPRLFLIKILGGNRKNKNNPNSVPYLYEINPFGSRVSYVTHPYLLRNLFHKNKEKLKRKEIFGNVN